MVSLLLTQISNVNSQISEEDANVNIRESITSGIYTAGNLNVNFDSAGLDANTLLERSTKVSNLVEFRTGNSVIIDNQTVDRVAFLTFEVEGNIGTTYNINSIFSKFSESNEGARYMKIYAYDENFWHTNINIEETLYTLYYHNYDLTVKSQLGFDGTIPIDINFDVSDYIPVDTVMTDGDIFKTTGMLASIDSVSVFDSQLSFLDSTNTMYQMIPMETMPSNKASDLDSNDYNTEDDVPEAFRRASYNVENAGLIPYSESTSYKTTSGVSGRSAQLYCQNGDLTNIGEKYQLRIKAIPQVQIKQQTFAYNKIISAANDWIYIKRNVGEETGEFPDASLQRRTITRVIGSEVYNVNVHFTMKVVVKLIVSTEFIPKIQLSDVSDSEIQDEIEYESGDEYWDNSLNQEVGDFLFDTSNPFQDFLNQIGSFEVFGIPVQTLLFIGLGVAAIVLIGPYVAPFILPLMSNISAMISLNADKKRRKRR